MYYSIMIIYVIILIIDLITIQKKITKKEGIIYGCLLATFFILYVLSINDIIPKEFYLLWLK